MWLPILLNNCLVERKGEAMDVSVLPCTCVTSGQERFLNFFPCLHGLSNSQLHSVILHYPHFLTLFGCALHEHRKEKATASGWCQCKLLWEEESLLLLHSN